jgi:hypothetical protein
MEYGKGPTIYVNTSYERHESGDFNIFLAQGSKKGIEIDYTLVENLSKMKIDNPDYAVQAFLTASIVLHEATHHGDRLRNNGDITADEMKDVKTGNQNSKSKYGHRGMDVEDAILGKSFIGSNNEPIPTDFSERAKIDVKNMFKSNPGRTTRYKKIMESYKSTTQPVQKDSDKPVTTKFE